MAIIGISGKIDSGKDTVGLMVLYLKSGYNIPFEEFKNKYKNLPEKYENSWQIKKFADKLKDIVCMLIGCTREQLEDRDFKEASLGEEWRVFYMSSFSGEKSLTPLTQIFSSAEEVEKEMKLMGVDRDVLSEVLTPRKILQLLGTDAGRNIIHPQIWVNSLFSDYKPNTTYRGEIIDFSKTPEPTIYLGIVGESGFPNWIITDMRFENELEAVKKRGGISIRVTRDSYRFEDATKEHVWSSHIGGSHQVGFYSERLDKKSSYIEFLKNRKTIGNNSDHPSETSLDEADFDYLIINDGSLEELLNVVRKILQKEKMIR